MKKWLFKNWKNSLIIIGIIIIMWFYVTGKKSSKTIINLNQNIEQRDDSILVLQTLKKVKAKEFDKLQERNNELEDSLSKQNKQIEIQDSLNKIEIKRIKSLNANESIKLLAKNLSEEIGVDIILKLNQDSSVTLQPTHVTAINTTFQDRDDELEKIKSLNGIIQIQEKEKDNLKEQVSNLQEQKNLAEKENEQLRGNIEDQKKIIKTMSKQNRRNIVKFTGIGTAIGAGIVIVISIL